MTQLRKRWIATEIIKLKELVENHTTEELTKHFPGRSKKAIERKIEKLRKNGQLGYRNLDTIKKSYTNRGQNECNCNSYNSRNSDYIGHCCGRSSHCCSEK